MASAVREPQNARALITEAAAVVIDPLQGGWHHPQVVHFAILVRSLARLLNEASVEALQEAQGQLEKEAGWFGSEVLNDQASLHFLKVASESLERFRTNPEAEIIAGRLREALEALGRVPLFGAELSAALETPLGKTAWGLSQGEVKTWVHRTLESITDERQLQKVVLRLEQASLPLYAAVRHGPLEYGKDVVSLFELEGRRFLRMYQMKAGNITMPIFRDARAELEEMFLVPLSDFSVPLNPEPERQGILLCNGHANSNVEPVMDGWFREQGERGRDVKFLHLDDIVRWIFRDHLINEFRTAVRELGLIIE